VGGFGVQPRSRSSHPRHTHNVSRGLTETPVTPCFLCYKLVAKVCTVLAAPSPRTSPGGPEGLRLSRPPPLVKFDKYSRDKDGVRIGNSGRMSVGVSQTSPILLYDVTCSVHIKSSSFITGQFFFFCFCGVTLQDGTKTQRGGRRAQRISDP